jgi:hypothetical protein
MDILFKDLKTINQALQKKNELVLIDYLNSFDGKNTFEKFKNILINWESDVSPSLNLNLNDKPTKIALSYIISEISSNIDGEIQINGEDVKIILDIPKTFDTLVQETIPLYSIIKYINISGISINLIDLNIQEKKNIIDSLPAKVYNIILQEILSNKTKIVEFSNPILSNFKFNFLTNEPYFFLRGLINNFGEDYYKDIIFHLSKRIDGILLMGSTPLEIEYYIEKYSEEMKTQNDGLQL